MNSKHSISPEEIIFIKGDTNMCRWIAYSSMYPRRPTTSLIAHYTHVQTIDYHQSLFIGGRIVLG